MNGSTAQKLRYADYTNFPQIFRNVYWGTFLGDPGDSTPKNRNKFVEDYSIIKAVKAPKCMAFDYILYPTTSGREHERDHFESYVDKDNNYVFVFSSERSGLIDVKLRGYNEYLPIYSEIQTTYVKVVPKAYGRSTRAEKIKRFLANLYTVNCQGGYKIIMVDKTPYAPSVEDRTFDTSYSAEKWLYKTCSNDFNKVCGNF